MPTDIKDGFTFFWRPDSPFSQWHACGFAVDGRTFGCAEQFMMHGKAVLFADAEVAAQILDAPDPRAQKALGRKAGTELVEASPTDRIWGIGMASSNPDAIDRTKWRGLNLLGRILTRLRDDLLAGSPGA